MSKPASYGDTLARAVDLRIDDAVADTAAITALTAANRTNGMLILEQATSGLWWFDDDSAVAAGPTVLAPDAGTGRWLNVGSGGGGSVGVQTLATATFTSADLTAAGVAQTINVGTALSQNAIVLGYRISLADAFDNAAMASIAMELGHTNDPDAFEDGFDVFTASAYEAAGNVYATTGPGLGVPAFDGTSVGQCVAVFTANADQLLNCTDGSVTIDIFGVILA